MTEEPKGNEELEKAVYLAIFPFLHHKATRPTLATIRAIVESVVQEFCEDGHKPPVWIDFIGDTLSIHSPRYGLLIDEQGQDDEFFGHHGQYDLWLRKPNKPFAIGPDLAINQDDEVIREIAARYTSWNRKKSVRPPL